MTEKLKFNPTQEMIDAARAVFEAMAWEKTIRPIVRGYQKEILLRHQFTVRTDLLGTNGEVVLEPEHTDFLKDEDFRIYILECNEERKKAGLQVNSPEFCPLLVAESDTCSAKKALIKAMEPITKISAHRAICSGLDNYYKLVELSLKLLAPFVKEKSGGEND